MKNYYIFLALLTLLSSCDIQKRKYQKGYHITKNNLSHKSSLKNNSSKNIDFKEEAINILDKENVKNPETLINNNELLFENYEDSDQKIYYLTDKQSTKEVEIPKTLDSTKCDVIICFDGSEIDAKVFEVGITEIKYKKCNFIDGPNYSINKKEVLMIKYSNGTKDVIKHEKDNNNVNNNSEAKGFAITSLVTGILSSVTFYGALIFGICAIIFGQIAMNRIILKNPEDGENDKDYKMAKAGLILGIIGLVALAILFLFIL